MRYHITALARRFGLSRSTLLYYDRMGLLVPSARTEAGYRVYTEEDLETLEAICSFRQAGLTVEDIRRLLALGQSDEAEVLRQRMEEIGRRIRALRAQQRLLRKMLEIRSQGGLPPAVDKEAWVGMLKAAGMDEEAMARWHREFERRAPEEHHEFLLALGIPEEEARLVREAAAGSPKSHI